MGHGPSLSPSPIQGREKLPDKHTLAKYSKILGLLLHRLGIAEHINPLPWMGEGRGGGRQ